MTTENQTIGPQQTVATIAQTIPAPVSQPTSETPVSRRGGLGPRWSYIISRGLVVAGVWSFFTYGFDPLVRVGLVTAGQTAVKAKVDLPTFKTKFFPPRLQMTHVAIANRNKPGTNLIEFADLTGEIDGFALAKGSYIIDKASITGLSWGTPRADSGLLPNLPPEPEDPNAPSYTDELQKLGKDWGKSLLDRAKLEYDPRRLETVRLADHLEDEWKDSIDAIEGKVKGLEGQVKLIKSTVDGAKKGDTNKKIDNYLKVADDSLRLLKELEVMKRELEVLPGKAKEDLKALDEARKRDTAEIRRKLNDLVLDSDNLSEFLLGPTLNLRVQQSLEWLGWVNGRVDEFAHPPKPERFVGEDILFPSKFPLPKYMARLIELKGEGDIGGHRMQVTGDLKDVNSAPQLVGKPFVARLNATGFGTAELKASLDRTQGIPIDDLDLEYTYEEPLTLELGDKDSFVLHMTAQRSKWTGSIRSENGNLSGVIYMVQRPAQFRPEVKDKIDERLQRLITNSLSGISKVEASVTLAGTVKRPQMKLKTNLGPAIANGIKDALGNELSAQQEALVAQLDEKFKARRSELISQFNSKYGNVAEQLNIQETTLKNLVPKTGNIALDPSKLGGLKSIFR